MSAQNSGARKQPAKSAKVTPTKTAVAKPIEATESVASPIEHSLSQVTFLTVAEVAKLMRVSKMTVYRLVHSGELTAVRVGRSFRVPERAVHDYLDQAYIETA